MTKVSYDIQFHGRTVKNVSSYEEARGIISELGNGWMYKVRYTEFDPNDTPEYREACRKHAEKVAAKMAERRAALS